MLQKSSLKIINYLNFFYIHKKKIMPPGEEIEFDFDKIEKLAVDLINGKEDQDGNILRTSYTRHILVDGEWIPLPDKNYYEKPFIEYMRDNFEVIPELVEDDCNTYIYKRKPKEEIPSQIDAGSSTISSTP